MKKKRKAKATGRTESRHFRAGLIAAASIAAMSFVTFGAATPRAYAAVKTEEADHYSRINSERAAHGVPALKLSECISRVARQHSFNMSEAGSLYHNNQNSQQINAACGVWTWTVAENVASGGGTSANSATLFQNLLNSPCHHANIDSRTFSYPPCNVTGDYGSQPYSHVGVGSYRNSTGSLYITQVFVNCTSGCSGLEQTDTQMPLADWTPPPPPPSPPAPSPVAPQPPAAPPASGSTPKHSSAELPPPPASSPASASVTSTDLPQNKPLSQDKPATPATEDVKGPVGIEPISSRNILARFNDNYRGAAAIVLFTAVMAGLYLHNAEPLGARHFFIRIKKILVRK